MNNELELHKKSDKVKWIITTICFVLIFAFIIGIVAQFFVRKSKSDDTAGSMLIETKYNSANEMNLVSANSASTAANASTARTSVNRSIGVSAYATGDIMDSEVEDKTETTSGNTVQITAVVRPENATIKTVSWGACWTSSTAEWVQGKNALDYLKIELCSDDTLTVNITCLQPFNSPITIVCTSDDSEDGTISATCKAQFARRATDVRFVISASAFHYSFVDYDQGHIGMGSDSVYGVSFNSNTATTLKYSDEYTKVKYFHGNDNFDPYGDYYEYSSGIGLVVTHSDIGTVDDFTRFNTPFTATMTVNPAIKAEIESKLGVVCGEYTGFQNGELKVPAAFAAIFGSETVQNGEKAYNVLQPYFNAGTPVLQFTVTFTGKSGIAYEFACPILLNCAELRTAANGVQIPSEIII